MLATFLGYVTQVNDLPGLGGSTFEQTSNLVLGVDSKTRIVSANITLEVVVVAQVGCLRLGIHVFLGTRSDRIEMHIEINTRTRTHTISTSIQGRSFLFHSALTQQQEYGTCQQRAYHRSKEGSTMGLVIDKNEKERKTTSHGS